MRFVCSGGFLIKISSCDTPDSDKVELMMWIFDATTQAMETT